MDQPLAGKKIAILVASGFEELEMTESQKALLAAGASLPILSNAAGLVNGWHGKGWGHYFPVDKSVSEALGADYDGLLLPGGERSTTKLMQTAHTRRIVGSFLDAGKPVACIGQGAALLAFTPKIARYKVAAPEALREALEAQGAVWVDEAIHEDRFLLTARDQSVLPEFVERVVSLFAQALDAQQQAA